MRPKKPNRSATRLVRVRREHNLGDREARYVSEQAFGVFGIFAKENDASAFIQNRAIRRILYRRNFVEVRLVRFEPFL